MLIRAQGGSGALPGPTGTAIQWPLILDRYSMPLITGPLSLSRESITSSTGVSFSCHCCTVHWSKAKMSWPSPASASAPIVRSILLPMAVRKSRCTSTWFFAAHLATTLRMASLPAGTQWSHIAQVSLPAAPAVWICTSGSAVAAAASFNAPRRVIFLLMDGQFPCAPGVPPDALLLLSRASWFGQAGPRRRIVTYGRSPLPGSCDNIDLWQSEST